MQAIALDAVGAVIDIPVGTDADGVAWDFTGATLTVLAYPPSGGVRTWTASAVTLGSDGQAIRVITGSAANAVDERGVWHLRPRVVAPSDATYPEGRDIPATHPVAIRVA